MSPQLDQSSIQWQEFDYSKTKIKNAIEYGKCTYARFAVCVIPYKRRFHHDDAYRLIFQKSSMSTWHRESLLFCTIREAKYAAELHNNALYVLEVNKALSEISRRIKGIESRDEVLINTIKKFALLTNRELKSVLGDDYSKFS
ncbi:MAG: hypothetical protein K0U41_06310 [Gammaproteobacteria bacterium]|nr:hypothetical protein [Gammaproteobacteria bacterium]